jgi:hypothetical protein
MLAAAATTHAIVHLHHAIMSDRAVSGAEIEEQLIASDIQRNEIARLMILEKKLRNWVHKQNSSQKDLVRENVTASLYEIYEIQNERQALIAINVYIKRCRDFLDAQIHDLQPVYCCNAELGEAFKLLKQNIFIDCKIGNCKSTESKKRKLDMIAIFEEKIPFELYQTKQKYGLKMDDTTHQCIIRRKITELCAEGKNELCTLLGINVVHDFVALIDEWFKDSSDLCEVMEDPAYVAFLEYYANKSHVTFTEIDLFFPPGGDFKDCNVFNISTWRCRVCMRHAAKYCTCNGGLIVSSSWGVNLIWLAMTGFYVSQLSSFTTIHLKKLWDDEGTAASDLEEIQVGLKHLAIVTSMCIFVGFMLVMVPYTFIRLPRIRFHCFKSRGHQPLVRGRQYCCANLMSYNWELAAAARINRTRYENNMLRDRKRDPACNLRNWTEYDSENENPEVATLYYHIVDQQNREKKPEQLQLTWINVKDVESGYIAPAQLPEKKQETKQSSKRKTSIAPRKEGKQTGIKRLLD